MKFYGNAAKAARVCLGLKSEYVAENLNISRRTLWSWENARNIPSEKMVKQLAKILKVNVSQISDLPDEQILSEVDLIKNSSLSYETESLNDFDLKFKSLQNSLFEIYNNACNSNLITNALLAADKSIFYIKNTKLQYVIAGNYYKNILKYPDDFDLKGKTDNNIMSLKDAKVNEAQEREILLSGSSIVNKEMIIPGTKGKRWGGFF